MYLVFGVGGVTLWLDFEQEIVRYISLFLVLHIAAGMKISVG